MTKRIRYNKVEGNPILVSSQFFRVQNKEARILINKEEMYFEVIDKDGNALVRGGKTKNYCVLLQQAKEALRKLGVHFGSEFRGEDKDDKLEKARVKANKLAIEKTTEFFKDNPQLEMALNEAIKI